jgi:hypothetical protein
MFDSMWLFTVTFTTVGMFIAKIFEEKGSILFIGYGDLTPSTYCGRSKLNKLK